MQDEAWEKTHSYNEVGKECDRCAQKKEKTE